MPFFGHFSMETYGDFFHIFKDITAPPYGGFLKLSVHEILREYYTKFKICPESLPVTWLLVEYTVLVLNFNSVAMLEGGMW